MSSNTIVKQFIRTSESPDYQVLIVRHNQDYQIQKASEIMIPEREIHKGY